MMSDAINPDHYKRLPVEAIEIIEAMIAGAPDNKAAYLHGQAAKYDLRLWGKGKSLEDFLSDWGKHIWYALRLESHLLELIEKQKADEQQKAADLQSLKDHPFGKLKTAPLNSDTIPEGYRKLGDSSIEPRQVGDLYWSVSKRRYVAIVLDHLPYANRDNWAACRKVEPAIKQSSNTEPPEGWRFLEVGEVIRKGDRCLTYHCGSIDCLTSAGEKFNHEAHYPTIRRNRFEVGEKVVENIKQRIGVVKEKIGCVESPFEYRVEMLDTKGNRYFFPHHLAPYIEETT